MKSSEHKTNKINYGAMTIKVESKTTDDVNYEVRITDDTLYRSDNISDKIIHNIKKQTYIDDKIIAVLSFNTINPDSLKIISSSKDYSSNMRADIIRTSLFTTFANININRTNDCLTTSIEKANFLVLNKTKNDFKGYISVPKVIIS